MKKKLNIGVVGCGFMGRTHSNAFRTVPNFFDIPYEPVLKTVCARSEERARSFAAQWGYESFETDWRKLVESAEIDLIDIASPNDTHAEIALAAANGRERPCCAKSRWEGRRRNPWQWWKRWKKPGWPTWSGTTTGACRP